MRTEEIMTKSPTTLAFEAAAQAAADLMAREDVGFIPVVDGKKGTLLGVVTDRDLVVRVLAPGLPPAKTRVGDVMTKNVLTCARNTPIKECGKLMADNKVSRIVVVDGEKRPIGVVSLQNLTQAEDEDDVGETVKEVKEPAGARH